MLWFNLLLIALVVALVVVSQMASRRNFVERATVATDNLAAALAQSVGAEIDRVDVGLRNVVFDVEQDLATVGAIDPARAEALLDQQLTLLPQIESIRIADAQGVVRHGRGVAAAPRVSVAEREHFVRSRDAAPAGPVVSGPMEALIGHHWAVMVARPLRDPKGQFAGIVYANVTVERFALLLEGVDLGRQGAITVRGSDLALVARRAAGGGPAVAVGSRQVSAGIAGTTKATSAVPSAERMVLCTLNASGNSLDRMTPFRLALAMVAVMLVASATRASNRLPKRAFRSCCTLLSDGERS